MRADDHSPRKLVLLILNFCGLFESKSTKMHSIENILSLFSYIHCVVCTKLKLHEMNFKIDLTSHFIKTFTIKGKYNKNATRTYLLLQIAASFEKK